jgi:hypothetical protein
VFYIVQAAITHQSALVELTMFHELQDNVLPDVNPVPLLVYQVIFISASQIENNLLVEKSKGQTPKYLFA